MAHERFTKGSAKAQRRLTKGQQITRTVTPSRLRLTPNGSALKSGLPVTRSAPPKHRGPDRLTTLLLLSNVNDLDSGNLDCEVEDLNNPSAQVE